MYSVSKSLLMPILLMCYLSFLTFQARMFYQQRFCILALILHCLGDILLLFPRTYGKRFMLSGIVSFFIGHISYTLWFTKSGIPLSEKEGLVTLFFMMIVQYFLYRYVMLSSFRKFVPLVILYSFGLVALAVVISSTLGNTERFYAPLISLIGVFFFYFSDYCVARRAIRVPLFGQMVIMSTYITAQTLIITGMLLMQI